MPPGGELLVHETLLVNNRSTIKGSLKAEEVRGEGDLLVEGDLESSDIRLDDGTSLEVKGDLKADDVDVPNSIRVGKRTEVNYLRVGEDLTTLAGSKAGVIDITRRARVRGPIIGTTVRIREDAEVEDVYAEDFWTEGGCSLGNIYVKRAEVGRECSISGVLQYVEAIRLGRDVSLASPPVKVSTLPSPPI
jgi:predicted acyltransferase (DUF342 family)